MRKVITLLVLTVVCFGIAACTSGGGCSTCGG